MSENELVGSLILRTIDVDPTRIAPSISVSTDTVAIFDNSYGTIAANGGLSHGKM